MEITPWVCSLRQILTRRRENEAGPFRAAETIAGEQLSLPRREASNDPFENGGDQVGDHGVKRMACAGAWRRRRGPAGAHGRKRQARDR